MNLNLLDLSQVYTEHLFLPFSEAEKNGIWQQSQEQNYHNPAMIWNDFNNRLSLKFLDYLQAEINTSFTANTWLPENELAQIWQGVNGTAIDIKNANNLVSRLVLIPTNETDITELIIPREWLDLSEFVGNYYVAVQINNEENFLQIWGYISYQELKEVGKYDEIDETYSISIDNLAPDLTSLYVNLELNPSRRPKIKNKPQLNPEQVPEIIKELSLVKNTLPRLDVPFVQWGEIINNPQWRNLLFQESQSAYLKENDSLKITSYETVTNLLEWFNNSLTQGWATIESLINSNSVNLAYSFRQANLDENQTKEAVKLVNLQINEEIKLVGLNITLDKQNEDKISVKIKLLNFEKKSFLPEGIKLLMLKEDGKIIQQVCADNNDNLIQLKRFTTKIGKKFQIKIVLGEFSYVENFVIN